MPRFFFSAVFYGALNELSWAKAFVRGLKNDIYQHEDILWVDLWREPQNFSRDEEKHLAQRNPESYRRWLADPTTQLLIYRWLQHSPSDRQKSAPFDLNEVYLAYRKHIADGCGATLPDIEVILEIANARTTLYAPPFISAYAEGKLNSASLTDPAWFRVLTNKGYTQISHVDNQVRQSDRGGKLDFDINLQLGLLRQIRNIILRDKAAGANSRLIAELEFFIHTKRHLMSPTLILLAQWATQLLSSRISKLELRKKSPEKATTVDKYLGLFSRQLLEEGGPIDIKDLAPDELRTFFERIVTKVIELKSPNLATSGKHEARQAKYTLHRLNQFLGYVHFFHGLPQLGVHTDGSIIGKTVRANLITPGEFSILLAALGWGQKSLSRQQRMTIIAAILAFRTGMRVVEICGLQIGDIQGTTQTEVLVRPNKFRGLKSRSSRRRLPLHIVLPPEELAYVREWHRYRASELGATRTCPLFCAGPLETRPCSAQELFYDISETLKTITGDPTVVPHTLRHSFATWLLCKLLLREDAEIQDEIGVFAGRDYDKATRRKLRTELLVNENSGKKILHATAALLGHADTDTLLHTYMHLTDWLCCYYSRIKSSRPPLTAKGVAQILHCSQSHATKILSKDNEQLLSLVRKKALRWSVMLKHPLVHQLRSRTAPPEKHSSFGTLAHFDEHFHALYRNESSQKNIKWPKTIIEMYAIHWLWERLINISRNQKKITSIICLQVILGYRNHDKAIITHDVKIANQIFIFLSKLGIEYTVKYYASRGEDETENEKSLHHWRKHSKGQAIGRGRCKSKKNSPKGIVRIFLSQIQLSGYNVEFDSSTSNSFLILLKIFLNIHNNESYLSSETTPKTS